MSEQTFTTPFPSGVVTQIVYVAVWKYAEVALILGVFKSELSAKQHCIDHADMPIGVHGTPGIFAKAKRIDDKDFLYAHTFKDDPAFYIIEAQEVR